MTENKNPFPTFKPKTDLGFQKIDRLGSKTAPINEENVNT
jgi:hypothetical protein